MPAGNPEAWRLCLAGHAWVALFHGENVLLIIGLGRLHPAPSMVTAKGTSPHISKGPRGTVLPFDKKFQRRPMESSAFASPDNRGARSQTRSQRHREEPRENGSNISLISAPLFLYWTTCSSRSKLTPSHAGHCLPVLLSHLFILLHLGLGVYPILTD